MTKPKEFYFVTKTSFNESLGFWVNEPHGVLFSTADEALAMSDKLGAGCDLSFYDPKDNNAGFLWVDSARRSSFSK